MGITYCIQIKIKTYVAYFVSLGTLKTVSLSVMNQERQYPCVLNVQRLRTAHLYRCHVPPSITEPPLDPRSYPQVQPCSKPTGSLYASLRVPHGRTDGSNLQEPDLRGEPGTRHLGSRRSGPDSLVRERTQDGWRRQYHRGRCNWQRSLALDRVLHYPGAQTQEPLFAVDVSVSPMDPDLQGIRR